MSLISYNSTVSFFDDLQRLRESRPLPCIVTTRSENCDYAPYHPGGRNCYLIVGHVNSEDCMYGFWVGVSRDCIDCAFTEKSELCYESIHLQSCYNCNFCQDCISCSDCDFCYDCKGCSNCYGCVNLRNKQFCVFNEQFSKEDFSKKVRDLRKESYRSDNPPSPFVKLKDTLPHINMQGFNNEDCVGDHIFNSKNAFYDFDVSEQEDTMYVFNSHHIKDCIDINYSSLNTELCYMCHSGVTLFNSNFCSVCWYGQNLEYCEYVFNSHDCFGCVSRSHAEYEILNVKYSKDEYFKNLRQIKDELRREGTYGKWWWPSPYEDIKPFCSYM